MEISALIEEIIPLKIYSDDSYIYDFLLWLFYSLYLV